MRGRSFVRCTSRIRLSGVARAFDAVGVARFIGVRTLFRDLNARLAARVTCLTARVNVRFTAETRLFVRLLRFGLLGTRARFGLERGFVVFCVRCGTFALITRPAVRFATCLTVFRVFGLALDFRAAFLRAMRLAILFR